ncbi:MAG TPA: TldD/PmbA family protein [Candidatus Fimicola cottocaccae]|nr:TldD/PmbA family protein [Candidatus Fimicola cottocaccae]
MDFVTLRIKVKEEAEKLGFTDWEITFSGSQGTELMVRDGQVDHFENSIQHGIAFRGNVNGKTGYSYSEKIDDNAISYLVKEAFDNAELIEEEAEIFFEGSESYPEVNSYNDDIECITPEKLIENAVDMEKSLLNSSEYMKAADYCLCGKSSGESFMANSKGLNLEFKQNMAVGYVSGIAENDGDIKTGGEYWYGCDIEKFSPKELGEKAGKKIVSHMGAKSIPSAEMNVVFENEAMSDILATFSGVFFAENAQKGFSMLEGKKGTLIGSEILNIKDDGICEKSGYSIPFDSEGVAVQNKYVIEKGVLKTLLYNLKSASKDNTVSTGNGFKAGLKSPVVTTCTNFYIEKGNCTRNDIIKSVCDGIIITDVTGLHAGANTISGDFSLSAEGFLIENGNITSPVEQITVAGNFYDILKNIEKIADDVKFSMPSGMGVFGSPAVFVGKMSVSGM